MAADPEAGSHPKPIEGIAQRDLGTEYVFYDARGERFHVLNETAREIYLLCNGSRSLHDIARALTETREIDPQTAFGDAKVLVEQMVRLGLLTLA